MVAPFVGAWIETALAKLSDEDWMSLPSWERGLKLAYAREWKKVYKVAPFVGAWIETDPKP